MEPLFWPGLEGPFRADRQLAVAPPRQRGPRRIAAESVSAVPGVEHGVRQLARRRGNGPRAGTVFLVLFSAAAIRRENHFRYPYRDWPRSCRRPANDADSGRARRAARRGGRIHAMMDLVLEAWVAALIEQTKLAWMLGAGRRLAAGRDAEAALRRLQRHAQHRLGCARRGDAAAGAARPGRGERRAQRDDAEFRADAAAISATRSRSTCRTFFRRFCIAKCASTTA